MPKFGERSKDYYKKNRKDGFSKLFDKQGCLKSISNYSKNVKSGEEKIFYTSGKIKKIRLQSKHRL